VGRVGCSKLLRGSFMGFDSLTVVGEGLGIRHEEASEKLV
jgi:hypothetical protein